MDDQKIVQWKKLTKLNKNAWIKSRQKIEKDNWLRENRNKLENFQIKVNG